MICAAPAPSCAQSGPAISANKILLDPVVIQTTEWYLGAEQDFVSAVNDNLGLGGRYLGRVPGQ